ncbi:hypothetical protein Leryth_025366 [Lithospermum erythrorhizon]|nr:hypothetical protein Leryth_025366 [Lithospermum erythrorhizon]
MTGVLNEYLQSGLNVSSSDFQDGSGRSLASVYSTQSGASSAVLHNSGPQGIHDSYNMASGYMSRNPTMMGAPSNGIQQVPGSLPLSNSHGHSGLPNNGGSAVAPNLGGAGRITNNIPNLVSGGNMPRSIATAGGSNLSGVASRLNLTAPQMVSMLGNSYNGVAASLTKSHYQAGNSHLSSMTMLNEMNAHDSTAFESEFPQLNHRPNSAGSSQGNIGYMRKQTMGFGQQNQEFSIQNEDFPALPGYRGLNSEFPGSVHGKEQFHDGMPSMMKPQQLSIGRSAGVGFKSSYPSTQQLHQHSSSTDSPDLSFQPSSYQDLLFHGHENRSTGITMPGSGSSNLATVSGIGPYDQSMQQYQQLQKNPQFRMVGGSIREQELMHMQTSKAASDRYGIYGLLNVIRMTNPALTALSLGIDLTTLGLNLNSSENLHKKFSSPWSNEPAKGDPEYSVPECYISQQQPPLKQGHFTRITTESLFYIFYSMPKDEAQLYAANELHTRGWFYHKDLRLWLTRDPKTEPLVKTNTYERGCYITFDPNTWLTMRKDNFVMQYELIEKRPILPQQSVVA